MCTDAHLSRARQRGGALLSVMWLSAALTAIAFSIALSVRAEVERTENSLQGLKAEYLARAGLDRALNYMMYGSGPRWPDGRARFWERGAPFLRFRFPTGDVTVELIPETSKLSVNDSKPEELVRLLLAMGVPPSLAQQITMAIVDWRSPSSGDGSPFDALYLASGPSFRAPHASLQQIEELLSIQGVTPELYYGRFDRLPDGTLIPRAGLSDCLSIYTSGTPLDLNTVQPEVMLAVGAPPQAVQLVTTMRRALPILPPQLPLIQEALAPAGGRFRLGGDNIWTVRATARLRQQDGSLSDLRRSASMVLQLQSKFSPDGFRILRWQPNAAVETRIDAAWAR